MSLGYRNPTREFQDVDSRYVDTRSPECIIAIDAPARNRRLWFTYRWCADNAEYGHVRVAIINTAEESVWSSMVAVEHIPIDRGVIERPSPVTHDQFNLRHYEGSAEERIAECVGRITELMQDHLGAVVSGEEWPYDEIDMRYR
jgi:hypothetical protein